VLTAEKLDDIGASLEPTPRKSLNRLAQETSPVLHPVLIFVIFSFGVVWRTEFTTVTPERKSRDSVVGIAIGYGLDDRRVGVRVPVGSRIFCSQTSSRPALGPTQPPIQGVPRALSSGVKRPWREFDHSLPTSAEVKKIWIYTTTPQYIFMGWCLIKHRENFTLPLTPKRKKN
jgi:hypothetical protein